MAALSQQYSTPVPTPPFSKPSPLQWRQFPFFDASEIKDIHDPAVPPEIFNKTTAEISTITCASVGVLVADIHGSIHILDKDFESVQSWLAHVGGRVTHMIEKQRVLVTLGEEDSIRTPLLKIWKLDVFDKQTGSPNLLRSAKVHQSNRPHPVTTIALSASLSHLAIGLADGTVLLYRNLDHSIASGSGGLTSLPKPRSVFESAVEPITGLGFKEPVADEGESANLYLFIVTTNRVLSYQVSGKGSANASAETVHEVGCALRCATMDWKARDMVVARDEAIYTCRTEGRGVYYAYEGHKSSVHTHLNYLVIVSPPFRPTATAASATVRNFVSRTGSTDADITKVNVFDLENKLVAYSGTFTQGIREIFSAWGKIYILCNDGSLSCLKEKPTPEKLDMLYRKSHYLLALNLAKTHQLDRASIADIHRQYGDHLYSKGDFDGAMQQFVQTIGDLQPSYVIRKFLDAQKIHNLVTYLQELHALGLANSDHTTLLLNTYTKLKDVARLDSFIKAEASVRLSHDGGETKELHFDLDTAIRVCRQAGYFKHASYLAKRYGRHEDYLRIQIEDAAKHEEALTYLRRLGPQATENSLARYGRALLMNLPEQTTQLLIDLCTFSVQPTVVSQEATSPTKPQSSGPSYISYLALSRATAAPPAVTSEIVTPPSPSIKTLRQSDVVPSPNEELFVSPTLPLPSAALSTAPKLRVITPSANPPSPRLYFPHFADHMDHFVVFLETVAHRRWGQSIDMPHIQKTTLPTPVVEEADIEDQIAVWNTLLELYLTLSSSEPAFKIRVQKLLESSLPYDPMHALILCSNRGYTPGLVLIWEKMGMYEDVLRFWMDRDKEGSTPNASTEVIRCLNLYGPAHPHLYALVLRFLTSSPELLARHRKDIADVLKHIDEKRIMGPVSVIEVLSRNKVASIGLVKDWLMGRVQEAREEIRTDRQLINSYRLETAAKLKQVRELSDPDSPRVFHVTRCSSCGGSLDLPSVHFMCNHSYHQRCLVGQEVECPNCAREYAVIREIRKNNEQLADQQEVFLSQVQDNGFSAVASAYSRGLLNAPRSDNAVI